MSAFKWSHIRNTAAALALAASLSHGTVSTVGGNVQVVNLLNSAAQAGLDLTSTGTLIEIANFTINQNTTSYDLAFQFTNGGRFVNSSNAAQTVDMTGLRVTPNGGTLGTTIVPIVPATAAGGNIFVAGGDLTALLTPGTLATYTWNPADQTTPTSGYILSLRASWVAATTKLAGLYTETITATLTATL